MKIIIAGSRDFNDYDLLLKICDKAFELQNKIEVVSAQLKGLIGLVKSMQTKKDLQ